jgi:hypothetical protein
MTDSLIDTEINTAPRIFLSYAAEDAAWKSNFIYRDWFGDLLGPVTFTDYKMGENLPFGALNDWLESEVQDATAFIPFISKSYIAKNYPVREWWAGLSKKVHRNLIFVPIILDGSGKLWWSTLKKEGFLGDLGNDYAYSDFTDGNGRPAQIITATGLPVDSVTRRIGELARLIRAQIEELRRARDADARAGPGNLHRTISGISA